MSEGNPYKQAAKAIKAKGLLKLKFYCQMCQKQCRDAAGFKAHTLSEGHQRQMQIFRSNPAKFINQFSDEFKRGFLDILKTRHGKKQVQALRVYNEYINDKHHIHMNSTQWTSLGSFVKYLGKTGICKVTYDEEKETWFLQYIVSESNLYNTPNGSSIENDDVLDEKRKFELYERQFKALKELEEQADEIIKEEEIENNKDSSNQKPVFSGFSLSSKKRPNPSSAESSQTIENPSEESVKIEQPVASSNTTNIDLNSTDVQSFKKMKTSRDEGISSGWLKTGIILKIVDKSSEFYNEKALVLKTLKKKRVAQVELLSDQSKLVEVSQDNLQTVIPKVGAKVMILKHETMRGKSATLTHVDFDKASATVLVDGVLGDNQLILGYDDFSKIF